MRLSVSVPVLSVAMTVTEPSASTADRRRTTARWRAMRSTPSASATVRTAGSPSGTAATASATAKMIICGARETPFGGDAGDPERHREEQDPAGDLPAELVDAPFERRRGDDDLAEHRRQPAHRTAGARSGDRQEGLSAHEQRAAERLVARRLVDRHGLAGQDRFVEHRAVRVGERTVGRYAVAGLEPDVVARHELRAGQAHEVAIAQHPRLRGGERLQVRQRRLGPLLLIEPERGVEQQDDGNRQRFNRPAVSALVDPQARVEDEGEEQDVDEGALELPNEAAPERVLLALGQGIGTQLSQPNGGICGRKAWGHPSTILEPRRWPRRRRGSSSREGCECGRASETSAGVRSRPAERAHAGGVCPPACQAGLTSRRWRLP